MSFFAKQTLVPGDPSVHGPAASAGVWPSSVKSEICAATNDQVACKGVCITISMTNRDDDCGQRRLRG